MRTGVMLIDGDGKVRLANEAALLLIGSQGGDTLQRFTPELDRRLRRWRHDGVADDTPMRLAPDLPEVVPRFTRLLADSDQSLVFLDDTTLLSRRAESMTLATLGRFSASLAHEIRNPLAAISYATQLLEESKEILDADRRLLEIIHQQTMRMNGIVENVLGLARRERAQPEYVELVSFARRFTEEYRTNHPLEGDTLQVTSEQHAVPALADPRQLHQVLVALVHNALTYGRMPGQSARVNLHIGNPHGPQIDIMDRGPGIPETVAAQLFRPFFTTSGHGTGLGLYIARELCLANQATLEYVAMPGGGCCFRIRLAGPHSLLPT
jgi:two-component system sensor histidine kinase PilS (NtrC family)